MRVFTALPMTDWREAGPAARAAEDIGFDVLRTAELGHEVFIPLAFAALATERVELTPSVAIAFPRSPTIMASIAWDLQANSRGRFVLGLGSQVKGHNERRFGDRMDAAGAANARLHRRPARDLALLGDARKAGLPQRPLHA